jgi:hypothetical protein
MNIIFIKFSYDNQFFSDYILIEERISTSFIRSSSEISIVIISEADRNHYTIVIALLSLINNFNIFNEYEPKYFQKKKQIEKRHLITNIC